MTKYFIKDDKFERQDPPYTKEENFLKACEKGDLTMVKEVLSNDNQESEIRNIVLEAANEHGENGFLLACTNNREEIVQEILKCSATSKEIITAADILRKENGLHTTSAKGYYNIAKQIVDYYNDTEDNQSINLRNDLDKTAYDLAKANNNDEIAELLKT